VKFAAASTGKQKGRISMRLFLSGRTQKIRALASRACDNAGDENQLKRQYHCRFLSSGQPLISPILN